MKNIFALGATGGLAAAMLISSLAYTQDQDQQKTRHVMLTKVKDGTIMHLDTVLSGNDVFVWKGDTIDPEKHIREFSPSGFDRLHNTDRIDQQRRGRIYRGRNNRMGERLTLQPDSGPGFRYFSEEGDSAGRKIRIQQRLRNGQGQDHLMYFNGRQTRPFPGAPSAPSAPNFRQFRGQNAAKGINLNDPNVISYKKKDMGGGREKIEIIRKKSKETENFDFERDHLMQVPAPPAPSAVDQEFMNMEQKQMEKESKKAAKQQKAQQKKKSLKEQ